MKKISLITGAAMLAIVTGCAGTVHEMAADSRVPAAEGELKASEEGNGNTKVAVKVKHMAKPHAVEPMAQTYVVWAQDKTSNGVVQNLGQLQVDDDLEGKMEGLTPMKAFDVFITAEPVATAQYPTGTKTLWTTVDQN